MNFVTGLPISTNRKKDSYNSILVIVDWLTKTVYYKLTKITINTLGLAEVIINMIIKYHGLFDSIVTNRGFLFILKFWLSLCYFFSIKRWLSIAFHPQTDSQTKRQKSTMKAYLQVFINFKQNDWARLLPIAEFVYNNAKNASIGHTVFKFNCGYHPRVFFKEDSNPHFQSKTADKLLAELQELITICWENLYHAQKL